MIIASDKFTMSRGEMRCRSQQVGNSRRGGWCNPPTSSGKGWSPPPVG